MNMAFCEQCGAKLPEGAAFCEACGASRECGASQEYGAKAAGAAPQAPRPAPAKKTSKEDKAAAKEHLITGTGYLNAKDYPAVIAEFNQAIALDPQSANSYKNRGLAYHRLGQYDRAIADLTNALTGKDKDDWLVYSFRAQAYRAMGDAENALADLITVTEKEPFFSQAYRDMGEILVETGDYPAAVAAYNKALKLAPRDEKKAITAKLEEAKKRAEG
jgi:tetratricopeptide (TPR) repeat protein